LEPAELVSTGLIEKIGLSGAEFAVDSADAAFVSVVDTVMETPVGWLAVGTSVVEPFTGYGALDDENDDVLAVAALGEMVSDKAPVSDIALGELITVAGVQVADRVPEPDAVTLGSEEVRLVESVPAKEGDDATDAEAEIVDSMGVVLPLKGLFADTCPESDVVRLLADTRALEGPITADPKLVNEKATGVVCIVLEIAGLGNGEGLVSAGPVLNVLGDGDEIERATEAVVFRKVGVAPEL
jgi:hypothetical protein